MHVKSQRVTVACQSVPYHCVMRFPRHAGCVDKPDSGLLSFGRFLGPPPICSTHARDFEVPVSDFYVGPGHLNLGHQPCSAAVLLEAPSLQALISFQSIVFQVTVTNWKHLYATYLKWD